MTVLLAALVTVLTLAALEASRYLWVTALAVWIAAWTTFSTNIGWQHLAAWGLFLSIAAVLLLPPLRRRLVFGPLARLYRKIMPAMSDTERAALEAGTVGWEAELFTGRPDWNRLLRLPEPELSAEEQAFLDGPVNELCALIDDWQITEELRDLTPETWAYMKQNGFFGMIIPKHYGGLGFSANAHSAVVLKVASVSISAGVTVMVPNSLGPAKLLLTYGTEEQKDHYLPRLADGREIPCFALTGPEAGSDAAAMPDNGVVCRQHYNGEDDVLGIRLNWEKRYITLGPVATLLGLAFHLYDPDHLIGDEDDIGITLALIPTDTEGVEIGNRHFPMSQSFMNGPNRGRDVFIPMEWVIGGQDYVGEGWRMLMNCLSDGRAISLPALSTAAGKKASRAVGAYAGVRKQFNIPIGKFEGVSEVLARIAGKSYIMNAARGFTAAAVDSGEEPSVASAIIKYHMTEYMRDVVNDGMDILGGRGISMGPNNFMARAYEALPIGITVEGANILTRNLIIFGQGAIRCHPWLFKEMQAAASNDTSAFDTALSGHVSLALGSMTRSLLHGLTGARFLSSPVSGPAAVHYRRFGRMAEAFAVVTEMALATLGGNLKRRESLSGRLGDVLSNLYLGSTVLKHFHDNGSPEDEVPLLDYSCDDLMDRIQSSLDEILVNLPNRPAAWLARALIFPLGKPHRKPADRLGQQVADILLAPGALRDRLSEGVYIPEDSNQPLAQLDDALEKAAAAEPAVRKLRAAMRDGRLAHGDPEQAVDEGISKQVITTQEGADIRAAMEARKIVIQVDDFHPEYLTREQARWSDDKLDGVAGRSS